MLTHKEKQQALRWYAREGYDLQTIADHFKLTLEELKAEIRT